MKDVRTINVKRLLFITIVSIFTSLSSSAQTKEITILTTAQCGECKENIEKALLEERGVKFAQLDIKSKQVKVIYNAKKITPEQIRNAISLVGYDADDVPADEEAVKRLSPCCTKDGHKDH